MFYYSPYFDHAIHVGLLGASEPMSYFLHPITVIHPRAVDRLSDDSLQQRQHTWHVAVKQVTIRVAIPLANRP